MVREMSQEEGFAFERGVRYTEADVRQWHGYASQMDQLIRELDSVYSPMVFISLADWLLAIGVAIPRDLRELFMFRGQRIKPLFIVNICTRVAMTILVNICAAEVNEAKRGLKTEALRLTFTLPSVFGTVFREEGTNGGQQGLGSRADRVSLWQKVIWFNIKVTKSPVELTAWRIFTFRRGIIVSLFANMVPLIVILAQFIGEMEYLSKTRPGVNLTAGEMHDYEYVSV